MNKYLKSLTFDLSGKVCHVDLLSVYLNIFFLRRHKANWTQIHHGLSIDETFEKWLWSRSCDKSGYHAHIRYNFKKIFSIPKGSTILFMICSISDVGSTMCVPCMCLAFSCVFVTFPCGVLGQVWCWIVSSPDLSLLFFFSMSRFVPHNWILDLLYDKVKFVSECIYKRKHWKDDFSKTVEVKVVI